MMAAVTVKEVDGHGPQQDASAAVHKTDKEDKIHG